MGYTLVFILSPFHITAAACQAVLGLGYGRKAEARLDADMETSG